MADVKSYVGEARLPVCMLHEPATKLIILASRQQAELFIEGKLKKAFKISTAAKGLGCEAGSHKTPIGLFSIAEKIGAKAPPGTVFKGRQPTGALWSNDTSNPLHAAEDDLILTRILWLDGSEAHNANTKDRFIYIHGTNHELHLGVPASHGCIRMSNRDIVEIFDLMAEGASVEIRR